MNKKLFNSLTAPSVFRPSEQVTLVPTLRGSLAPDSVAFFFFKVLEISEFLFNRLIVINTNNFLVYISPCCVRCKEV